MLKNTKVFFCNTCVMSNQKVLSSSTIEDDVEHSNRHKLDFKNVPDKPDIKLETYWYS